MAEDTLVEGLVADSIELVNALDQQGDAPSNVLWYLFSDAEEWRLLIAGLTFNELLPKNQGQAYQKVAAAIERSNVKSITIADVKIVQTDDPILVATKFIIQTPPDGIVRAYFRDNVFNGIFVKEMLVLRAA